jgi:hypothetical protein
LADAIVRTGWWFWSLTCSVDDELQVEEAANDCGACSQKEQCTGEHSGILPSAWMSLPDKRTSS